MRVVRPVRLRAVSLLCRLCRGTKQLSDRCPQDAGTASGDDGIDDLPFAVPTSQRCPLRQVLLDGLFVAVGRFAVFEAASKLLCMVEGLWIERAITVTSGIVVWRT